MNEWNEWMNVKMIVIHSFRTRLSWIGLINKHHIQMYTGGNLEILSQVTKSKLYYEIVFPFLLLRFFIKKDNSEFEEGNIDK